MNKQRIVGVVVLVAFIALLVPFLFTSGIKKKILPSDEIPINAQKRQLITKQIQNINTAVVPTTTAAATTATPVAAPVATAAVIPPPSVISEQPANTTQPPELPQDKQFEQPDMLLPSENNQTELSTSNQSVVTVAQAAKAVTNTTSVVPQATSEPAAVAVEASTPVAPIKAKAIPKNKATKKSKVASKTKTKIKNAQPISTTVSANAMEFWSVQVGSFSDEVRAQKLITQLHDKGFHVYTQKITTTTGTLTRVLVGHEASKETAIQLAGQLESNMKIKGRLIRNQK